MTTYSTELKLLGVLVITLQVFVVIFTFGNDLVN